MKWSKVALGSQIYIKHGFAFKGEFFSDSGKYILLTPGNCHETGGLKLKGDKEKYYVGDVPEEFILHQNDLLVVMTDLVQSAPILGGALLIPENEKYLHNQRLGLVNILNQKELDKKYLYYLLNTHNYRSQIKGSATGTTVKHTAPERIYRCLVPLPPLQVQQKIADILSKYDDLIENNRRRIELLERSARLLYKEWFVRLRFPGHEHTPIIDGIPEGWEKVRLKDIADLTMGQSPESEYYNEDRSGLPFHQGVTNFGIRFPENKVYCAKITRIANEGDILFSVRAPVGRMNISLEKIIIGRGLAAIRAKHNYQGFLYYHLKNYFFKEDMIGSGVIFASVTKAGLENVQLIKPKDSILAIFLDKTISIDEQIKILFRQNQKLKQARDILLPKLMNGEIEV